MTHCPETGRACELDCGLGTVCVRIRAVPRCKHDRHPGECGQCLAGSSILKALALPKFAEGVLKGPLAPGFYRCLVNDRNEIVEVMNITDDGK